MDNQLALVYASAYSHGVSKNTSATKGASAMDATATRTRTWTAVIETTQGGTTVRRPAQESHNDLLRDQTDAAVREAWPLVFADAVVVIVLFRTTLAHGTVRDRSYSVYLDRRGALRYSEIGG